MKSMLSLLLFCVSSTVAYAYPPECASFENKVKEVISKLNAGVDPGDEVQNLGGQMNSVLQKFPQCKANVLPIVEKMAAAVDRFIEKDKAALAASAASKKKTSPKLEDVSYEDWYVLSKTGAQIGRRYRFVGCVDGDIGITSPTAKTYRTGRTICETGNGQVITYNTDSVRSKDAHKKLVLTKGKMMCVTAFIAGNQAHIYDVEDVHMCGNQV